MRLVLLLILLLCDFRAAHAQASLLQNGDFSRGLQGWRAFDKDEAGGIVRVSGKSGVIGTRGSLALVEARAGSWKKALRATARVRAGDEPWAFGVHLPTAAPLRAGDELRIKVWLRSAEGVAVTVRMEAATVPFPESFRQELKLTPQWREFEIQGRSLHPYAAGEAQVIFWLAHASGTVEIAGVREVALMQPELDLQFGHGGGVTCVSYSPDGKTIASGGRDGTFKLWEAASGRLLRTIRERDNGRDVLAVVFSPDGKTIATGCRDPEVRLRDVRTGALLRTFNGHRGHQWALAFSPDGKLLARQNISDDNATERIELVDVQSGAVRRSLVGSGWVRGLSFSPDGSRLASGSIDGRLRLWDVANGQLKQALMCFERPVHGVAFSPDGKTIAAVGGGQTDKSALLWDARTGALQKALEFGANLLAVAFAPDGKSVVGAGSGVRRWDAQTGALLGAWGEQQSVVTGLAFSPDGRTLAGGSDDTTISLWDASTGAQQRTLGFNATVNSVAASPNGSTLASSHGDQAVRLWDLRTGELKKVIAARGVSALLWSGDGKSLFTGDSDGVVQVWDAASGSVLRAMKGRARNVWALALSPDRQVLAVGGGDASVRLWDARTGAPLNVFWVGSLDDQVFSLAFSPDGKRLAVGMGGQAVLLDAHSGVLLHKWQGYQWIVSSVAFSPEGKRLATGDWAGEVKMWDASTGAPVWSIPNIQGWNRPVAFSTDGQSVICGARGQLLFLDAKTGQETRRVTSQGGNIQALCFTPDRQTLITGGEDSIKLWDAPGGRLLASIVALPLQDDALGASPSARAITADARLITADARDVTSAGDYLVVTSEGYYSGSATVDRYVHFRLQDESFPAECFQTRYYRPDMVRLALSGEPVPPIGELKGASPPLASFATPVVSTLTGGTATISVQASDDSEVRSVAFFVNGARVDAQATTTQPRPITADSRALAADSRAIAADSRPIVAESRPITADSRVVPAAHKVRRLFSATLPLPLDASSVKLQAIAFDDDGLQSPRAEITLPHTRTRAAAGKLLGLCVGVSRYRDGRLNLKFADKDADALAASLSSQKLLYISAQVRALTNQEATSAAVGAALDALVAQTTRADTVVVSLSGHGWRDGAGRFYFATHEVDRNDLERSALPWSQVVARLTRLSEKSKRVIVLLDACHSGSAATNEEMVKAILGANAGVMIFASSRGSEVSLENAEWGHGAFTKALLEAVRGQAVPGEDKHVTTIDLIAYVSRRVKALTEDQQHPQVPFLQDFDTDAPIVARP